LPKENNYIDQLLNEIRQHVNNEASKAPKQSRKFFEFLEAVKKPGALDTKTKELIAVALAVAARCKYCIVFHVSEALRHGAKPEEIREAGWVAVLMCGGPCFTYLKVLEDTLDRLAKS